MKLVLIVTFLACSVFTQSWAQPGPVGPVAPPPPPPPPIAPALAGPLGPGALGPLGMPGLPIIPPIIPPFLGFPFFRPFFGLRRFGLFGGFGFPFFGKRDTEMAEMSMNAEDSKADEARATGMMGMKAMKEARATEVVVDIKNKIDVAVEIPEPIVKCVISNKQNQIRCNGTDKHTIKCDVKPHIDALGSIELKIEDLDLIKREKETDILRLVAPKSQITAVNPKTKEDIVVSVWSGEQSKLVGFEVVDSSCWTQVKSLVGDLRPEELSVKLVIAPQ
jgi:hypothetical protein